MTIALLLLFCIDAHAHPMTERLADTAALRSLRLVDAPIQPDGTAYQAAWDDGIYLNLSEGHGSMAHHAWAVAVLDVGIGELWAALSDQQGFVSEALGGDAELLQGRPCGDVQVALSHYAVPVLADRWWVARYRRNRRILDASNGLVRELSWKGIADVSTWLDPSAREELTDDVQVIRTEGAWFLIYLDEEHTLLEYQLATDFGGGVASAAAANFSARTITGTIRSLETWAAQNDSRCPIE